MRTTTLKSIVVNRPIYTVNNPWRLFLYWLGDLLLFCVIPLFFLTVIQFLLWVGVNHFNQISVSKGYWQIYVVIPYFDLVIPDLSSNVFLETYYAVIFTVVINALGVFIYYAYGKNVFARYFFNAIVVYLVQAAFSLLLPCYAYLHNNNWTPYTPGETTIGNWAAFPSYHMTITYLFFITVRYAITKQKKDINPCARYKTFNFIVLVFLGLYTLSMWATILLVKQHYILDAVGSILICEIVFFILFKISNGKNNFYENLTIAFHRYLFFNILGTSFSRRFRGFLITILVLIASTIIGLIIYMLYATLNNENPYKIITDFFGLNILF